MIDAYPNSRNVIPGRTFITVDFRHPDDNVLSQMDRALRDSVAEICHKSGLKYELEQIFYYAPIPFDKGCVSAVRAGADRMGYSAREIVTGAGHDACFIAQSAPTSMIFIPCIDGNSHNEVTDIKPHLAHAGSTVILQAHKYKANVSATA